MSQISLVLLAATLWFLLGILVLSSQAACYSGICRVSPGSAVISFAKSSRIHSVRTPSIHRRASEQATSLELGSDTTGQAPVNSFPSTYFPSSVQEAPFSPAPLAQETEISPLSPNSFSASPSSPTSLNDEDFFSSSAKGSMSQADMVSSGEFSMNASALEPSLQDATDSFSPGKIINANTLSSISDTAGVFYTDEDIPHTTWNAADNGGDGIDHHVQKFQEVMPFTILLILMIAIGLLTGIRCAFRERQRRRQPHDSENQKSQHFSSGIEEKNDESYGWIDKHSTSRRMWSMMASRKGIKQKFPRPFGRRRAISESRIPTPSTTSSFTSPSVVNYMDVEFGVMIPDHGTSGSEHKMDGLIGLSINKSSPEIRKKPSRRVTGDYLVHTPSRPSPLRQSYFTP